MNKGNSQNKGVAEGLATVSRAWLQSTQDIQVLMADGVNPDGSLKPETILALMRFCGLDASVLGRQLGVSRQFVQQVIRRRKHSKRVEDAIADGLHLQPERIWGRHQTEEGKASK